jgi:hypothetical protein
MAGNALMQKILTEAPVEMTMKLYVKMNDGLSLAEAARELQEEAANEAPPEMAGPPGAPPGAAPGPTAGPPEAQAAANSLEKGGIPGNAPELPAAQAPLKNVMVKPPGA